ncbi:unnamed protein product [Ilex paraguariensis]|uniref:Uncharacterized protein n=1 Tax=Ilex paraguariensis TaxID=185542 RepID=A0ABC8UQZ4_9AQUA
MMLADGLCYRLAEFVLDVGDYDEYPMIGEKTSGGFADAACSAGDYGYFALRKPPKSNATLNHVFSRCSTVKKLFDGYDDLVTRFNSFLLTKKKPVVALSEAYNSTVEYQTPTSSWTTQIEFVKKVQKHFEDDVRRNKSFLDALGMWRFGDRVIDQLNQEVAGVFKELPDMYMEFKGFYGDFSEEKSTDRERIDKN